MAAAGIVLAVAGSGTISPIGVALALIAAAIYAAYVLASASLLGRHDPLVLAAAISTGAALVLGADAGVRGQLAPRGGAASLGLIVAAALFSSVLATSAFMAGVRRLGASRASIVSSAEPALTAVFAFAAFGQLFGFVQLLGASLVLASIPILELRRPATWQHHESTPPCETSKQSPSQPRSGFAMRSSPTLARSSDRFHRARGKQAASPHASHQRNHRQLPRRLDEHPAQLHQGPSAQRGAATR